jgi:NTP pyrophosphatase (non-canonical NTP hydrolase)
MEMDDYQKKALESIAIAQKSIAALAHRSLGLSGEAGIIANHLKKVIRDKDGKLSNADLVELQKRLGDALYYIAALADYCDLSLSLIAKQNLGQSSRFKKDRKV